jgi:hypothetical protein
MFLNRFFIVSASLFFFLTPWVMALEWGNHQLESEGYFRIGAGASDQGNQQVDFIAPGADSRLHCQPLALADKTSPTTQYRI